MLEKILIGNILSFFKYSNYNVEKNIKVNIHFHEKETFFKSIIILAFSGSFITNALIPDLVGLGKSVSRGFGTIKKII
jgi:hypothetical protein